MPGIVKVRILEARDLPIMDRASELTDAYVTIKFHEKHMFKTSVCSKTLCPKWNSEWFTFEADDDQLQDDLLQIKLFDKDTLSANDPIGKVHISLVPLTQQDGPTAISGWFPIFDTMHGIRGQLKLVVKVEYFSDTNKFRQSSCGIKFFYSDGVPQYYRLIEIKGFVEELVIEDDPEYKWIDKIRTTRASNEARQLLFLRLAGELQRKIGVKALELGGNAVVGYRQCFDLEGTYGVVVRAIGTCVTIAQVIASPLIQKSPMAYEAFEEGEHDVSIGKDRRSSLRNKNTSFSSETSELFQLEAGGPVLTCPVKVPKAVPSCDFPFYTISVFPYGFVTNIGGIVTARSVKLLDKLESMPEESDSRDKLWLELRKEIRSHMKTVGCTAVIGYSEDSTICDKLCVLSATGTAVVVDSKALSEESTMKPCCPCHIPYNERSAPFPVTPHLCQVCGVAKVPDIIMTTIDMLPDMPLIGNGCFIQAQASRLKKKQTGEHSANSIGSLLPFLEYELHRQLTQRIRVKGMNAIIGIRYQLCVGDTAVCCIASGTAVYLKQLPTIPALQVICPGNPIKVKKVQQKVQVAHERSLSCNQINSTIPSIPETESPEFNLNLNNKECVIVDIDDPMDEKRLNDSLITPFPEHFLTSNTSCVPGFREMLYDSSTIITQICRIDVPLLESKELSNIINHNIECICFKLRKYKGCFVNNLRFKLNISDDDKLIVVITGVANLSILENPGIQPPCSRQYHRFISSGSNEIRFCEEDSSVDSYYCDNDAISVQLTSSSYIPGAVFTKCFGHINLFLIRESTDVRREGGISSFTKLFIIEAQAMLRAHVASLGGNVLMTFRVKELVLCEGPQKSQAQILLNVSGDAANVNFSSSLSASS